MTRPIGYRGRQVLAFIDRCDRPPSYATIAAHLGFASVADVCKVVRRLERRGYLHRSDTGTRHRRGWHRPVIAVHNANYLS